MSVRVAVSREIIVNREIGTSERKMFIKIAYNGDVAFLLRWIHRDASLSGGSCL